MPIPTYLIVGLGNPGRKFEHTRHNVGFDVLTLLSQKLQTPIARARSRTLIGEALVDERRVVLAQPQTYMNLSGEAVEALMRWYRLKPEHLLVIYDDVDLPPGTLRIRPSGSAGTHNGMRSIIERLGTQAFPRIRVGVGHSPGQHDLTNWVLGHYNTPEERQLAFDAYTRAAEAALLYVREGIESAMNQYNPQRAKPPKENGPQAKGDVDIQGDVVKAAEKANARNHPDGPPGPGKPEPRLGNKNRWHWPRRDRGADGIKPAAALGVSGADRKEPAGEMAVGDHAEEKDSAST